jgi:flagellar biosynthesis anti-sigma factor FlgM
MGTQRPREEFMNVSPTTSNSPITRLQGSTAVTPNSGPQDVSPSQHDTVEISDSARYLNEIRKLPDIRQSKVDSAKASIANGTYETSDKIDATVNALLNELG